MAAFVEPKRAKAETHMAGALVVALPCRGIPDAKFLLADRHIFRRPARIFAQHLRQRELWKFIAHAILTQPQDSQRLRRL